MACWQLQTYSLEFKVAHKDLLIEAIKRMKLEVKDKGNYLRIYGRIEAEIFLDQDKIVTSSYYMNEIAKLKVEYSKVIVEKVAKARKWLLVKKNAQGTRIELKRF